MSDLATNRDMVCIVTDAKWAFLQSPVKKPTEPTGQLDGQGECKVVVEPPAGTDLGYYWDCEKAAPGLRTASRKKVVLSVPRRLVSWQSAF